MDRKRPPYDEDERLARLIRAAQAEADPALWTRVAARIRAGEQAGAGAPAGWLAWFGRPVALGAATAALVLTAGLGLAVLRAPGGERAGDYASLTEALLGEPQRDDLLDQMSPADESGAPRDTGVSG
jgi:hypothetical protein